MTVSSANNWLSGYTPREQASYSGKSMMGSKQNAQHLPPRSNSFAFGGATSSFGMQTPRTLSRSSSNPYMPWASHERPMPPQFDQLRSYSDPGPRNGGLPRGDRVDRVIGTGDVLVAHSTGNLFQIGALGGAFGHVMLVTGRARCIEAGSSRANYLQEIWPEDVQVSQLWEVPIVECTREQSGLHETLLILYVEQPSGRLITVADFQPDGELIECEREPVEVFQSPSHLREIARSPHLVEEILEQMRKEWAWANWSELTAVKAALMSSALDTNALGAHAMSHIREAWEADPICTSVPIVFWQRLLCKAAPQLSGGAASVVDLDDLAEVAKRLIHRWMPLAADRTLPGDLSDCLVRSGWHHVPQLRIIKL